MIQEVLKAGIAKRRQKLNKAIGKYVSSTISISEITMGDKINEILKGNIEPMNETDKKKFLNQIFDNIMEGYGVNATDSKNLWKDFTEASKVNAYHNFELLYLMLQNIEKFTFYKDMGNKRQAFVFRLFMLILKGNLDKMSAYKSVGKLYTEALTWDNSPLLRDFQNITLGLAKDDYELWQQRYVSETYGNLHGMQRFSAIKLRMEVLKRFDKGEVPVFENQEIYEHYGKFASTNIRKSISRIKRGWDY